MKTLSLFLTILSLLFCLPSGEKNEYPVSNQSVVKIAFPSDPASLDPLFSTDLISEKLIPFLHSTLFQLNSSGDPIPYLAKNYFFHTQKKELEITLPKNVSLTLVKGSLERLFTTPGPRIDHYKDIASIRIQGKDRIILHLNTSNYKDILLKLSLPASAIVGDTGPYKLVEWNKGNSIILKKNPYPINPSIQAEDYPDDLWILVIPQSTSGLFLFSKGELDGMKLSDFLLDHKITKENKVIEKRGKSVQYVAINNTNDCFDIHFRNALNYAIDRNKIIKTILDNNAELTMGSIPMSLLPDIGIQTLNDSSLEQSKGYPNHSIRGFEKINYNFKIAKQELEKSKCFPKIMQAELDFRMRADDENRSKGKAVAEYLKALGLNVKIRGMEKAPLYKENGEKKGDLTFLTWYADFRSPVAFLDPVFHSRKTGNGGNRSFFQNNQMDKFIENKDTKEALNILLKEKPWIFLWSIHENWLVSNKLEKYPHIMDML